MDPCEKYIQERQPDPQVLGYLLSLGVAESNDLCKKALDENKVIVVSETRNLDELKAKLV